MSLGCRGRKGERGGDRKVRGGDRKVRVVTRTGSSTSLLVLYLNVIAKKERYAR